MAGKQGRWAAGPGEGQPAGKLGTHSVSRSANSGYVAPQQADTKRYPIVARASSTGAKLLENKKTSPGRGEAKSQGTNVEEEVESEITGTIELTSLEEITNVSATQSRRTRLVRRLPLPAPRDPGDEEDEYTDVQILKSGLPELLELSESPLPAESLELSESVAPIPRTRGRGHEPRVGPLDRKPHSAAQESTLTELDPTVLPSEATRTIPEASAAIVAPADVPAKPVAKAGSEADEYGAIDVESSEGAAAEALSAGYPDTCSAMALDPVLRHRPRWLVAPLVIALGVGLYFAMGSPLSGSAVEGPVTQSPAPALATEEAERDPSQESDPSRAASEQIEPDAVAQPAEEAQMVLDPDMVIDPAKITIEAEPEPAKPPVEKKRSAAVAVATANTERAKRETERGAETKKFERPVDKREDVSPGGKQSAQQFYKKGISAFVGGKLAAAEREFQSALRADPGFALALRGLGLVYERQGQKSKAVGAFRRYLKRSPRAKDADKVNARISRLGG